MRRIALIATAVVLTCGALAGCVRLPLAAPQASVDNLQLARTAVAQPVQVGRFALAPGLDASLDKGISARGSVMFSSYEDSMAAYLREVLVTELKAAGRVDEQSPVVITGWLTRSSLEAPVSATGHGELGARFVVSFASQARYDRELSVTSEWPSAFVGADAIPTAFNQYTQLMYKLVGKLLADPDFQAATRR